MQLIWQEQYKTCYITVFAYQLYIKVLFDLTLHTRLYNENINIFTVTWFYKTSVINQCDFVLKNKQQINMCNRA
jgi:hypothetical protein